MFQMFSIFFFGFHCKIILARKFPEILKGMKNEFCLMKLFFYHILITLISTFIWTFIWTFILLG